MKRLLILFLFSSMAVAQLTPGIVSFNAGEVSPFMEDRIDFEKRNQACRTLQNMFVMAEGPAERRPGTKYIAETKSSGTARLISFEYSKTDSYILELGDLYMRVYRNGGQVLSGGFAYEVVTVFEDSELFELQYVQDADTMYIVHPNHPPQVLTRSAHTSWTIADHDIENGPFLPENTTTDSNITPSATTGSITLNSSENIFQSTHVGALWRISHRKEETAINGVLDANESSSTISIGDDYDYNIQGTWEGTVTLERSFDSGSTWEAVYTRYNKSSSINEDFSEEETEDGATYRVTMSGFVSGSATYNLALRNYMHNGYVTITAYTDGNTVTATVLSDLGGTTATDKWAEGSWSDYRGWPQTVEFHEQRLCFGGSTSYPQTFWASGTDTTGDYNDFLEGDLDDDAFTFVLPGQNPIQWMLSQEYIMMGTLGGAGRLGDEDEPLTPTTPDYRSQSRAGSANIQALLANDATLYVERGGRKIREFVYSLERDRFVAPDLTVLSRSITGDGIVDIAFQARLDPVLWCVTEDGTMACMTYLREQNVVAWYDHVTDGSFESVSVIPGSDEDEVWVVVNRTINGSTKRYVEQFQPQEWASQEDCWFTDSALEWDGGDAVNITGITKASPAVVTVDAWPTDGDGTNIGDGNQVQILSVVGMTEIDGIYTMDDANVTAKTFSLNDSGNSVDINSVGFTTYTSGGTVQGFENTFANLDHLEGETVTVFGDSGPAGTGTVSSGQVELSDWYNHVIIGLPYTSILETLPISFEGRSGSVAPYDKQIYQVSIDFYQTLACAFGADSTDTEDISFVDTTTTQFPLFTGYKHIPFVHGYWDKAVVYLTTASPTPLTVRSITPRLRVVP